MIFKHNNLVKGIVINRPSKINKSPYLVDVKIDGDNTIYMAHSPALGMSGLIREGIVIYMEKSDNPKTVSNYSIKIIENTNHRKVYIGANPVLANTIVMNTFINNTIKSKDKLLKKISNKIDDWMSEVTVKDCKICSRIDFKINNNYIEVKNVPLASHSIKDINKKVIDFYPKKQKLFFNIKDNIRYAVFPDGYTKKGSDVVSERAYKHLLTLEKLSKNYNSILIFTVLRNDCDYFIPNFIRDPIYSNKLKQLIENKKISCYCFRYKIVKNKDNFTYKFDKTIPIVLDFDNMKYKYTNINKINKHINI